MGSKRASKRGNARGAEGAPAASVKSPTAKEGKDEMIKASIDLQDRRRRIYAKC